MRSRMRTEMVARQRVLPTMMSLTWNEMRGPHTNGQIAPMLCQNLRLPNAGSVHHPARASS